MTITKLIFNSFQNLNLTEKNRTKKELELEIVHFRRIRA
jgi:hypothetical protein